MAVNDTKAKADWTIGRLLTWTTDFLRQKGLDEPRLATEVLLAHAAGCRRIELYTRFETSLTPEQTDRFRDWVRRAAANEPIAYLVGEREFFSLPFHVSSDVLIPRPETETLVEFVVEQINRDGPADATILDLGTGSGCLAVAILTQLREARAVASDVSEAALAVARKNAERHGVAQRMQCLLADGLNIPAESLPLGGFHVLVSNPPYIAETAIPDLAACIRDFEPRVALTDGGDGLSFYRRIAQDGARIVAPGGLIVLEIGDGQAPEVISTMLATGMFAHRTTWKDRVVGKERVVVFDRMA